MGRFGNQEVGVTRFVPPGCVQILCFLYLPCLLLGSFFGEISVSLCMFSGRNPRVQVVEILPSASQ